MRKKFLGLKRITSWLTVLMIMLTATAQPVAAQFFLDYTQNNIQTYDPRACAPGTSNTNLVGSDNQQKAYNFFIEKGLTPVQSASIVGNLIWESGGVNPKAVNPSSGAFGIAQWLGGRKTQLDNFAREHDTVNTDLTLQLDFLWWEVTEGDEKASLAAIKNETVLATNEQAGTGGGVETWERKFERAGEHEKFYDKRYAAAKGVLDKYGGAGAPTGGADAQGFCACESGKVVLIDPGHSKTPVEETDPESGIKAADYENVPEMEEVWAVSEKVGNMLEEAGFRVIMTKQNVNESVGLIRRAQIANEVKADIAVSIHNDHGQNFNDMKWVTPQETGKYRQTGDKKKTFENEDVANKSREYADKIVDARNEAEGGGAEIHGLDFPESRGLPAHGNISIVQLFSEVPWVYNEVGGIGWNEDNANKYAEGIANGIKSALGGSGTNAAGPGCALGNGDAAAMAVNYAWPDYRGIYVPQKPEYRDATRTAQTAGKYIGGCNGNDCGGFVTRVMQDSRADPNYNDKGFKGPVTSQEDYMKANPDKYQLVPGNPSSPSQLRPGDIAIQDDRGHTFMFVGDQPGFETDRASASYSSQSCSQTRAPMAGMESISGNRWYSLK